MVRSRIVRLAVALAACQLLSTTSAQSTATSSQVWSTLASTRASSTSVSVSATPSASSAPQEYVIKVGPGAFVFDPQELTDVPAGSTVRFDFYPPDHSVVQAVFGSACVPYSIVDKEHDGKGFWTDQQWVDTIADMTHYTITINDTEPIFFYCAAPGSCTDKLMVGAINPNSTQTLDAQIKAAEKAEFQLSVGQPVPKEATSTILNGPTSTPTAAASSHSSGTHLSNGAIAGIVVGAVAFLVICAALFFYVGRSKSLKEVIKRQDANVRTSTPGPERGYGVHSPDMQHHGSPVPGYVEAGSLPPYGQHNATDAYPSGWTSGQASPQMGNQGHMSMMSQVSGMSQEQLDYYKQTQAQVQTSPVELHSPEPGQQEFRAELENTAQKPTRD